jgi:hypothetical protein
MDADCPRCHTPNYLRSLRLCRECGYRAPRPIPWLYKDAHADDPQLATALTADTISDSGELRLYRGGCRFRLEWSTRPRHQEDPSLPDLPARCITLTGLEQTVIVDDEENAAFAAFREGGPAVRWSVLNDGRVMPSELQRSLSYLLHEVGEKVWPALYEDPSEDYLRPKD